MTSLWQNDRTLIGRVRIRTRLADPQAAQQKIARLLSSAVMRQSRLPPSSILCVRRLRDPLPGTRWLDGLSVHLGAEWEQAVTDELDRLAAGAAYPARAAVPLSAAAVAFLDRAEFLACLAQDWLAGTLEANWWWLALIQSGDTATGVIREWDDAPECIPAALELLAHQALALEFLRRLPEPVVARLLSRMLEAHGIAAASMAALPSASPEEPAQPVAAENALPPELPDVPALAVPEPPDAQPWQPWIPEASAAGLSPPTQLLLAYALLLRRAPHIARAPWFAARVERWRTRAGRRTPPARAASPGLPAQPLQAASVRSRREHLQSPAARAWPSPPPPPTGESHIESGAEPPRQTPPAPDAARSSHPSFSLESHARTAAQDTPLPAAQIPEPHRSEPEPSLSLAPEALAAPAEHAVALEIPPVPPKRAETPATPDVAAAIDTAFGGAFFLLNVAIYLGLYGDFAHPLHPCLELNIWDFLALFGREFAGANFRADAVEPVLADLAGRNALEPPGAHFRAPDAWRLSPEWLDQFPEPQTYRASIAGDRLVVMHPAAFRVIDVPLAGRTPPQALTEEIEPYPAAVAPLEVASGEPETSSLARWTAWLAPYLRARLMRALGRDDAPALLCRVPAQVRTTPVHVHVFMRLEGYPIEIRLAGLDRDPGWIPAAGRYVSFHFD